MCLNHLSVITRIFSVIVWGRSIPMSMDYQCSKYHFTPDFVCDKAWGKFAIRAACFHVAPPARSYLNKQICNPLIRGTTGKPNTYQYNA